MNKDYYVYLHRRRDNGVVFYIGKGRLSRSHTRIQRSSAWHEVNDAAGGFIVELLAENLSNSAAVDLENTYLRTPLQDWCLVNQAPERSDRTLYAKDFSDYLHYDPTSPSGLRWKFRHARNMKASLEAGSKDYRGYWQVRLNNQLYAAHRIIWALQHGMVDAERVINHVDNNPSNNNITNLESVTQAVNSRRTKFHIDLSSTGILYSVVQGKYRYWTAFYHDLSSVRHSRSFNCDTHGDEKAKQLAIEWRLTNLVKLSDDGAGYNTREP